LRRLDRSGDVYALLVGVTMSLHKLRVYPVNGGSDLVGDHLVGMRPGNVMANAFRAGCVRREALLFEWR